MDNLEPGKLYKAKLKIIANSIEMHFLSKLTAMSRDENGILYFLDVHLNDVLLYIGQNEFKVPTFFHKNKIIYISHIQHGTKVYFEKLI